MNQYEKERFHSLKIKIESANQWLWGSEWNPVNCASYLKEALEIIEDMEKE